MATKRKKALRLCMICNYQESTEVMCEYCMSIFGEKFKADPNDFYMEMALADLYFQDYKKEERAKKFWERNTSIPRAKSNSQRGI